MTAALLPDVEALVSQFLREHDDITSLVGQRVYTVIPARADFPLLRLTQFDSVDLIPNVPHLDSALLQFDAYGGPKATASLVGRTARAALHDLVGVHDEAVVTGVRTSGWRYEPDPEFTPAKPRFIFSAFIAVHPVQTGS